MRGLGARQHSSGFDGAWRLRTCQLRPGCWARVAQRRGIARLPLLLPLPPHMKRCKRLLVQLETQAKLISQKRDGVDFAPSDAKAAAATAGPKPPERATVVCREGWLPEARNRKSRVQ